MPTSWHINRTCQFAPGVHLAVLQPVTAFWIVMATSCVVVIFFILGGAT